MSTSAALDVLREHLEIDADRLCQPLLREGKNPMEDPECHRAFLALAHLEEVEKHLNHNQ